MTPARQRGFFITFEGGEGSGKSTQIRLLAKKLRAEGREVVTTREPGGSPMGERIRGLLLDPEARIDAVTQALLFSAARRDHVANLIAPALARGATVISDRFADSTRAYQQAAGEVPAEFTETITAAAVGATVPDLTIILDIPPEVGLARANARRGKMDKADTFEASDVAFHAGVRAGYLAIAAREPWRCLVVDAARPIDTIADHIWASVAERLATQPSGRADG